MKKHISVKEEANMSHSLFSCLRNENKQTLNRDKGFHRSRWQEETSMIKTMGERKDIFKNTKHPKGRKELKLNQETHTRLWIRSIHEMEC